jgi:hypothetical protein
MAARDEVATLLPGEECSAVFRVRGDRPVTASAAFRADGRRHTFRRRAQVERALM